MNNTVLKDGEFKITADQLKQLENGFTLPKLKEWFPEVFVKKLEVGKWYRNQDEGYEKVLGRVVEIDKNDGRNFSGYGFDRFGNFIIDTADTELFGSRNWREATEQEVFEALKNEAVKQGFVEGAYCNHENPTYDQKEEIKGFTYLKEYNSLYGNKMGRGGARIFGDGVWATIIPTKTREQAEKELNCKIID